MNAQGSTIEQRGGRPVMSSLHGLWSVGVMAGAATGPLLTSFGVSFRVHFLVAALGLAVGVVLASGRLIGGDQVRRATAMGWPRGALLPLAAVVFCAVAVEGAMLDWGGVYLRGVLDAPEAIAAAAGAVFSVAMALGRLSGDYLVARFPRPVIARAGAALAGLGVSCVIAAPVAEAVFVGLVAIGFGLAALVPLAFAAAGRDRDMPTGAGIAAVATVGYTVLMVGPPTIGLAAQHVGLRGAFLILPVLLACIVALAPSLGEADRLAPGPATD
jgi:hypothetical protein